MLVGAVVLAREEDLVGGVRGAQPRLVVAVDSVKRGHRMRRAWLVQDRGGENAQVLP